MPNICEYFYAYHNDNMCRCNQEPCKCEGNSEACSFPFAKKSYEEDLKELGDKPHQLSFELNAEVCSVIQDSGFVGTAEDYVRQYYKKEYWQLTVEQAEGIVKALKDKPGCLLNTPEGGYEQSRTTPEQPKSL